MHEQMDLVDDQGRTVPLTMASRVRMVLSVDLTSDGRDPVYTAHVLDTSDEENPVLLEHSTATLSHKVSGWASASIEVRYWLDRAQRSLAAF